MSFSKIKDPSKRDKLVAEYIKTKNKIQNDFRSERLGEQSMYEDFGKIFKPITEQQQKSSEEIVSKFAPLQEAIEYMPPALPWDMPKPELEEPQALELETLPEKKIKLPINIGPIGRKNLNKYLNKEGDTTFGFKYNDKDDEYYVGKTRVDFKGDDLEISGKRYPGTPGPWNLLTAKGKPVLGLATEEDMKKYEEIMVNSGAMRRRNDPEKPAANKGHKWQNIIKPIWDE